jgi:NAD(P)-dependent dehydrogenase (short-subunit alcohol dehydrogenase family)
MGVAGKVTIISGASGGLGAEVSRIFHQAGARVVLVASRQAGVLALADELGVERSLALAANLVNPAEAQQVVGTTLDHFGRVDILLNLAGGFTGGTPVSETDGGDLERMLAVNLRTTYNLSRAAVRPMLTQQWGRIVNTASRDALKARAGSSAYAISKAAVLRLTEAMAAEIQDYNITVNAILPGTIDTEANRKSMPRADFSKWVKPVAIAEFLLSLAGSEYPTINGASIPVYGRT